MSDEERAPSTVFSKWLVLLFSVLTFGSATGISSSLSVMFLDWQDAFSASRAHTAAIHSTCFSIVLGGAVFAGYVMNKIGARLTILIGSILASAGLFISAFATSINYLIVSVGVISGFGFCFVQLPVMPCATAIVKRYKTVVISLCVLTCALIGIVNRFFIRFLIEQYSWRGACMILAGVTLQTSLGGLIITSYYVKPIKNSLLTCDEERNVENCDNTSLEANNVDGISGCSLVVHGREHDSNAVVVTDKKQKMDDEDIYQIKDNGNVDSYSKYVFPSDTTTTTIQNNTQLSGCKSIVIENDAFFSDDKSIDNGSHRIGGCNLKKWKFFLDIMFILLAVHVGICVACLYSFCLILMDFARTLNFDESTGVLFLTVTFGASLVGRAIVGIGDVIPRIHSFVIQISMSIPGCVAVLLLSFITERHVVICLLIICGVSVGSLVAIYPKCALDVRSVNRQSYPIALGFFCTMEGMMSLVAAIAIGVSVDMTGSYTFILVLMGSVSLLSTFLLACGHYYTTRQQTPTLLPSS